MCVLPDIILDNAKREIEQLVYKYKQIVDNGRIKIYNEENTKREFITPLFRALGWDMENTHSMDEVTNEDKISRGRADYAFRINSIPKFFLEAKALNKGIDEAKDSFQAINYSWHKGTSWAILTDFKNLVVYNAEVKEKNLAEARFFSLSCDQYLDHFDKLWLLSKQGFADGLLDKEAESWGKKLRKSKVDDQLLRELMFYRELLSKNILKNNLDRGLTRENIDEAVQRIIDRLIFIRTTEDRGIEPPLLKEIAREYEEKTKGRITDALNNIFLQFDNTYNSKIFTYNPNDTNDRHICETLDIDNDVIIEIIKGLYDSKDGLVNYDFSAIDADVLGNIYEQYLTNILRKTEKRAKIVSKEAKRKEQGIYYTPTFIVDYIVRNTIGCYINKMKPEDIDNIKVMDMACGSGSFLIKAFDVINSYYKKEDKNYSQTQLDIQNDNSESLKITRKTRILKNNLFGIDLDPKAVEIAQLNLLLKTAETKHRLPDLRNNIVCGNSLVSGEISEKPLSNPETKRPLDLSLRFSSVINNGGFDIMIGNPPYVRQEEIKEIKPYLEEHYEVYQGQADLCVYFFERELKMLKDGGYFGMIVSNKWLKAGYGQALRKFLKQYWIQTFIDFGDKSVFPNATTYPCIIIIRKINKPNPKIKVCQVKTLDFDNLDNYIAQNAFFIDQNDLEDSSWNLKNDATTGIIDKIKGVSLPLKEYIGGEAYRGILTGLTEAYVIDEQVKDQLIKEDPRSAEIIKPFLMGKEVRRYDIDYRKKYIILTKIGTRIYDYPAILNWLTKFKKQLEMRWDQGNYWYELRACDYYDQFEKPKIIYGKITVGPRFSIDDKGYYVNDANFIIPKADKKLLAILNSKLGWFLIANTCTEVRGGYQLIWKYFGNVPVVKANSQELEALVDKMLSLNEKLSILKEKQTDERPIIINELTEIDKKIDGLVYSLYGLNAEDIKVVENNSK